MIAKIVCWGDTRGEAVMRMRRALSEFRIMGVKTNIPFHLQLIASLRFQAGAFDTRFVEDRFAIEDQELLPLAGKVLNPAQLSEVGRQMARRRGLAPADSGAAP